MKEISRDVIHTLRTVHQNQTQLNLMADQKANILIGTLVLVFTVVLTRMMTVIELTFHVLLPSFVLLLCEMTALVLTTLVLIPKNINGLVNSNIEQMPNPFFFGFFTRYSELVYQQFLNDTLIDDVSAHRLLITDIYQIGIILKRKYTLLRWAYIFAISGVALSLVIGLFILFYL